MYGGGNPPCFPSYVHLADPIQLLPQAGMRMASMLSATVLLTLSRHTSTQTRVCGWPRGLAPKVPVPLVVLRFPPAQIQMQCSLKADLEFMAINYS